MTNHDDIIGYEASRRDIYKGLSRCYQNPDEDLHKVLQAMAHHCTDLRSGALPAVQLLLDDFNACTTYERIRIDFARLFVGPYSLLAPPYGSIYLERKRRIMGQSTMDVIQFYRRAGLQIAPTYKEAPDHIAAELEFMYYLLFKEIRLLEQQDFDHAQALIVQQCEFMRDHLGSWIPQFTQIVKAEARTDFYRHLADANRCFIAEDREYLLNLRI